MFRKTMLALSVANLQAIAYTASALLTVLGTLGIIPIIKRALGVFRAKQDLNRAYYSVLDQSTQDRAKWKETLAAWESTVTALRAEMTVLKERLARVEGDLERLVSKYRVALVFIHELKSHIVAKDMPPTPLVLEQDLEREDTHVVPHE